MKRIVIQPVCLILFMGVVSCNRFRNKTEQVVNQVKIKTTSVVKEQAKKVVEKVFVPFDAYKPDTDNNQKRFKDFLKVELTPDVKNLYCFDDAIGIDADYMFSFNCSLETSNKIIEVNQLEIDTIDSDNGFGMQHDFFWWNKEVIRTLQKYSWTDGNQYFKYYWYDKANEKAYFFDFDM